MGQTTGGEGGNRRCEIGSKTVCGSRAPFAVSAALLLIVLIKGRACDVPSGFGVLRLDAAFCRRPGAVERRGICV
jgi:hypothetical protein